MGLLLTYRTYILREAYTNLLFQDPSTMANVVDTLPCGPAFLFFFCVLLTIFLSFSVLLL